MTSDILVRGPGPNDPCPCGSGDKAKKCCLTSSGWLKAPIGTLAGVEDGPVVNGCYAAPLGGCSGRLSREHYFSRSILSRLETIEIRGLPGAPVDEPRRLGINSLTAKILCERHNSALSPLDAQAGRFFDAFRAVTRSAGDGGSFALFSGLDIERWMLKTMLGFTASGAAPDEGRRVRAEDPFDPGLLRVLFEGVALPPDAGLYFVEPPEGRFATGHQSIRLLFNRMPPNAARIIGLQADMNGFSFAVLLVKPEVGESSAFNDAWFRPRQVWVRKGRSRNVVEFSWPEAERRTVVQLIREQNSL